MIKHDKICLVQKTPLEKFKTNTSINNPFIGVHAKVMEVLSAASHHLMKSSKFHGLQRK